MLLKDVINFQSQPFPNEVRQEISVAVEGTGEAAIELEREDGVFRSFTDTRVAAGEIRLLTIPAGRWRLRTTGGPATIEVK